MLGMFPLPSASPLVPHQVLCGRKARGSLGTDCMSWGHALPQHLEASAELRALLRPALHTLQERQACLKGHRTAQRLPSRGRNRTSAARLVSCPLAHTASGTAGDSKGSCSNTPLPPAPEPSSLLVAAGAVSAGLANSPGVGLPGDWPCC